MNKLKTAPYKNTHALNPDQVGWNWMLDGQPYGPAYYGNPLDADIVERAATGGRTVRLLYAIEEER